MCAVGIKDDDDDDDDDDITPIFYSFNYIIP